MLFLHLLYGTNSSAKISELSEFLLDFQKPLLALAVSNLGLCVLPLLTTILPVQFLKLHDLTSETGNLLAKSFEMIHGIKNSIRQDRTSVANLFAAFRQGSSLTQEAAGSTAAVFTNDLESEV